jgi:hypothetical protein
MNIIKEWWRDNVKAKSVTAIVVIAAMVEMTLFITLICFAFDAIKRAFPDDSKDETVRCECEFNHP